MQYKLTISIGFVQFMPAENTSPEKPEKIADEYLYQAKKNGKNKVVGGKITEPYID